jgi:hypothetical protein
LAFASSWHDPFPEGGVRMRSGALVCILACLIISGCGDDASSRREAEGARIFDAQRNALDKAKAVQETVNQSATQRDQQSD